MPTNSVGASGGAPAALPIRIRSLQRMHTATEEFLRLEALGGVLLVTAAVVAMVWANSHGASLYDTLLTLPVSVRAGVLVLAKPLLLWINDGLMAIFFLLVGLEIKREALESELSSLAKAALPMIAAVGGLIVPALIYAAVNSSDPPALRGWAIPTATDIAFALGALALLGDRVSSSLKLFLLALAIIDDLGAIVIIAAFYTSDLAIGSLALAGAALVMLAILNRTGVTRLAPYILVGIFLRVCVLKSGVHATLAGVALAFAIPLRTRQEGERPLLQLEHALHPLGGVLLVAAAAVAMISANSIDQIHDEHHEQRGRKSESERLKILALYAQVAV